MKRELYVISLILLLLLPLKSVAQNNKKLWIEINSGQTLKGLNQHLFGNSEHGWHLGTGLTYRFNPNLEVGTKFAFQSLQSYGETHKLYETSFDFRLMVPFHYVRPFFYLGSGIYFYKAKLQKSLVEPFYGGNYKTFQPNNYTWKASQKGFSDFGLGLEIPFSQRFQIRLEGRCTNMFDGSGSFLSVTEAFQVAI